MIIAVDQAIPYWKEAFSAFGKIRPFPGRGLKLEDIRDADALIVRTVTPVNADILEGTSVRFVGAASAGIDHIDRDYLKKRGIHFSYAIGCNANAVSEYIITALHVIASRRKWELKSKSLAVIGVGNVGSRVAQKAQALGMQVLLCDPPLRDLTGDSRYQYLDDVLGADILSFHVPLAFEGPYPTWHMLDRKILGRLSSKQFLINSARGPVFDNQALKSALLEARIEGAILDVWEEEPVVDYSLLERVDIGSPHIAGTTLDGKIRATEMIREELCKYLGIQSAWNTDSYYPQPQHIQPDIKSADQDAALSALQQVFNINKHDADLRALGVMTAARAAADFEQLRSHCPLRPEFRHFVVDLGEGHSNLAQAFTALGFKCSM
jgi:erythronate-4-phosphate dehydrogenase